MQGLPAEQAVATLREAGFEVRVERILGGVFGTARSTEPAGGTAPKGSTVVLNVV
uniref:PASTA domain-containing protein n=1 Tax=Mobilicoccus pelagius TaxID=746032 RepID=UPI003570FE85